MVRPHLKYCILLLPALWLVLLGSTPPSGSFNGKKLTADYVFIPGGTLGDSAVTEFYISAIEITNKQYRAFITDLLDSGETGKARLAMVDTLQWRKAIPPSLAYMHHYFQDTAYNDYPVVNISREAAGLYCDWLTAKYNSSSKQKVHFALPTQTQWEYAALGGNPKALYPWPGNGMTYEKKGKWHGGIMCNYKVDSIIAPAAKAYENADIIAPARSFMPNTYGVYNMGGNVAEMILDNDYTKGGSYLSHSDKILIAAHEDADLSHGSPAIGFRPVMVLEH